jgi:hypothetical protein
MVNQLCTTYIKTYYKHITPFLLYVLHLHVNKLYKTSPTRNVIYIYASHNIISSTYTNKYSTIVYSKHL